jgi:hypothetical protein
LTSLDHYNLLLDAELKIAERSHKYRKHFGVADKLYVDIIEIIEFKVRDFIPDFRLVVRRDIELEVTARTTVAPPRIYVQETVYDAACEGDTEARKILAHELGHLLMHSHIPGSKQRDLDGYVAQFDKQNLGESSEDQADVFARHFMVPAYVAFANRADLDRLARITGTPRNVAAAAVTISKRQEMTRLRAYGSKKPLRDQSSPI